MTAYHFLRADMTAGAGHEAPWKVSESRTIKGKLQLCRRGYHSSPTLWDAFAYAAGSVACLVEVSEPIEQDATKAVSRTRKLLKAVNIENDLRLFAADCAERVLHLYERAYPSDQRPRQAIEAARALAAPKFTAAYAAACTAAAAAGAAARATASTASAYAAYAAAHAADAAADAVYTLTATAAADAATAACAAAAADAAAQGVAKTAGAARASERKWQQKHFAVVMRAHSHELRGET